MLAERTAQPSEPNQFGANRNRTGGGYTAGPNNWFTSDGTFNHEYVTVQLRQRIRAAVTKCVSAGSDRPGTVNV